MIKSSISIDFNSTPSKLNVSAPKSRAFWSPILEKVQKHLSYWKRAFFSREDNLMLSGILMYFLSLFKISCSVSKMLEKNKLDFFMEGVDEGGSHLVNWDTILKFMNLGA